MEKNNLWGDVPEKYVELLTKQLSLKDEDMIFHSNTDIVSKYLEKNQVPFEIINKVHIIISKIKSKRNDELNQKKEGKKERSEYPPNFPILKKKMEVFEYILKLKRYMKTFKVDEKYYPDIIVKGCNIRETLCIKRIYTEFKVSVEKGIECVVSIITRG